MICKIMITYMDRYICKTCKTLISIKDLIKFITIYVLMFGGLRPAIHRSSMPTDTDVGISGRLCHLIEVDDQSDDIFE